MERSREGEREWRESGEIEGGREGEREGRQTELVRERLCISDK